MKYELRLLVEGTLGLAADDLEEIASKSPEENRERMDVLESVIKEWITDNSEDGTDITVSINLVEVSD